MLSCANKTGDKYWNACQVPAGRLKGSRVQSVASVAEASAGAELDPVLLSANVFVTPESVTNERRRNESDQAVYVQMNTSQGPIQRTCPFSMVVMWLLLLKVSWTCHKTYRMSWQHQCGARASECSSRASDWLVFEGHEERQGGVGIGWGREGLGPCGEWDPAVASTWHRLLNSPSAK